MLQVDLVVDITATHLPLRTIAKAYPRNMQARHRKIEIEDTRADRSACFGRQAQQQGIISLSLGTTALTSADQLGEGHVGLRRLQERLATRSHGVLHPVACLSLSKNVESQCVSNKTTEVLAMLLLFTCVLCKSCPAKSTTAKA
jgi:hypothetical protein